RSTEYARPPHLPPPPHVPPMPSHLVHTPLQSAVTEYGEFLSGPLPHLRVATFLSARQLIKADSTGGRPFIDQLNDVWAKLPVVPPTLSISGGHHRLEFHA